jgi:hypothetical protein
MNSDTLVQVLSNTSLGFCYLRKLILGSFPTPFLSKNIIWTSNMIIKKTISNPYFTLKLTKTIPPHDASFPLTLQHSYAWIESVYPCYLVGKLVTPPNALSLASDVVRIASVSSTMPNISPSHGHNHFIMLQKLSNITPWVLFYCFLSLRTNLILIGTNSNFNHRYPR